MEKNTGGVAFFDSGIGGITVMAECAKYLRSHTAHTPTFYYYGDNAHAPYGNLPVAAIQEHVFAAFERFASMGITAAVVACNTATAVCVDELRKKFPFPVLGTEPAVFTAAKQGGEVVVLVTRATYESERFHKLCQKAEEKYPQSYLRLYPCDGLAGAIEEGIFISRKDYAQFFPKCQPDGVVLGCTHYVYLKKEISSFYGCRVYDGNEGVAKRLAAVLSTLNEKSREKQPPVTPAPVGDNIHFIGSDAEYNRHVFEQMFAK